MRLRPSLRRLRSKPWDVMLAASLHLLFLEINVLYRLSLCCKKELVNPLKVQGEHRLLCCSWTKADQYTRDPLQAREYVTCTQEPILTNPSHSRMSTWSRWYIP